MENKKHYIFSFFPLLKYWSLTLLFAISFLMLNEDIAVKNIVTELTNDTAHDWLRYINSQNNIANLICTEIPMRCWHGHLAGSFWTKLLLYHLTVDKFSHKLLSGNSKI